MSNVVLNRIMYLRVDLKAGDNYVGFPIIPLDSDNNVLHRWTDIFVDERGTPIGVTPMIFNDDVAVRGELATRRNAQRLDLTPTTVYYIQRPTALSLNLKCTQYPANQFSKLTIKMNQWSFISPLSRNSNLQSILASHPNSQVKRYVNGEWVRIETAIDANIQLFEAYLIKIIDPDTSHTSLDHYPIDIVFEPSISDFNRYFSGTGRLRAYDGALQEPTTSGVVGPVSPVVLTPSRKPQLVSAWSDSIKDVNPGKLKQTALTAQAIDSILGEMFDTGLPNWLIANFSAFLQANNVFAGDDILHRPTNLPFLVNTNIDVYHNAGIYRIYDHRKEVNAQVYNAGLLEGTFPPIDDYTGYLEVFDLSDTLISPNPDTNRIRIRQTIYPDDPNSQSPWTRVGYAESKNGEIQWSEWSMMGGGMRRIVMESTVYEGACQRNAIYESYGSFDLQLPDPATVQVGTKIGLEQYGTPGSTTLNSGRITCSAGNLEQITTPETELVNNVPTCTGNAIVYMFECCHDDNGNNEWVMDISHDDSKAVADIASQLEALKTAFARKCAYHTYNNISGSDTYWVASNLVCNSAFSAIVDSNNVFWYDQFIIFPASVTGSVKFPLPVSSIIPEGATITIEIRDSSAPLSVEVASDATNNAQYTEMLDRDSFYSIYTYVYENRSWRRLIYK